MGLDFDITSAPPDTATIAAVHEELAAERQRLRGLNKLYLTVVVTIIVALVCFILFVAIPITNKPGMEGSIIFIIVYSVPYLFFAVFVVGNTMHHYKVEVPRKAVDMAEEALEESAQEDIGELRDACQAHAPLGAYQRQVASQGRALFKGELEAMRRWLEEHTGK